MLKDRERVGKKQNKLHGKLSQVVIEINPSISVITIIANIRLLLFKAYYLLFKRDT